MKVAIGPLGTEKGADWPLVGAESIAGHEVVPFSGSIQQPSSDVCIWWSPEYNPPAFMPHAACKVAILGDWHVTIPDLTYFDLICTDWRGIQKLRQAGYPDSKLLHYRMFSFDPRLHYLPENGRREIDIAFCGRPQPERDQSLERLQSLAMRRDWNAHFLTAPYLRGEEANAYRHAKVVFNQSVRGELNMRLYESMACGAIALIEQNNAELYRCDCPAIPWGTESLEPILERLLEDDGTVQQYEWVQRNKPVDHLRWLLNRIEERLNHDRHTTVHGPSAASHRCLAQREEHPSSCEDPRTDSRFAQTPICSSTGTSERLLRDAGEVNDGQRIGTAHPGTGRAEPSSQDCDSADCQDDGATHHTHQQPRGGERDGSEPELNEQRREVAALVPEDAKTILDLGCGSGGLGWWLTQGRSDRCVMGVDQDITKASVRLHGVWADDLDQLETKEWQQRDFFDCIILADVVEHLKYPDALLKQIRPLLKPDGSLVLSIPNGLLNVAVLMDLIVHGDFPYYRQGVDPCYGPPSNLRAYDHIRWFTPASIERLLHDAGYGADGPWQTTLMGETAETVQFAEYLVKLRESYMEPKEADVYRNNAFVLQYIIRAVPDWTIPA